MKTLNSFPMQSFAIALVMSMFVAADLSVRAEDEPKPLATAKHPTGLVVDVLSVSVDETQGKLRITWRYTNPTKKAIQIVEPRGQFVPPGGQPDNNYWKAVCVTSGDLEKAKAFRHAVISTKTGVYDATDIRTKGITVPANSSYEIFAKFAKPEAGTKKIHFQLPQVEQFENLSVTSKKND